MLNVEETPEFVLWRVREALGLLGADKVEPKLIGRVASLYGYTLVNSSENEPRVVVVSPFLTFNQQAVAKYFRLTPTQMKVAALIACRRSNAEIARALGISPNTTRRHTEAVMFRMRVASRTDVEQTICDYLEAQNPQC